MKRAKILLLAILCLSFAGSAFAQNVEYVGSALFSGPFNSVHVVGDYAYCVGGHSLHILSITDPSNPYLVGGYAIDGEYAQDLNLVLFVSGEIVKKGVKDV
jgi:hypothetical protein